ncbi:MAG: methylenetetrahydrofolate--tRNA-(uracil(54)-C(5))-methyltransferase (FADH(2)-oxidizing) TrmFO [Acidaminococcales bacterium]|nr:methylenetetrahydrofolate--tRNA-(uracil(54)-C(5))-methyltransferase (FADH(2)-oxidizing) TrmFO [Acidaminococcales bacterium]
MLSERKNSHVTIIGAGLAGCEAAWQLARSGVRVALYEMRPGKMTPAHKTGLFAELVCSNSLRAENVENAVGLLKKEMSRFDSLIMRAAAHARVPAGGALAVDREEFPRYVTEVLGDSRFVDIIREEAVDFSAFDGPVIVAAGPLMSDALAGAARALLGEEYLYFYDAAAPLLFYDSIDKDKVFRASRYGKGGGDYLNCPLTREEYLAFRRALVGAELARREDFAEKPPFFEGCVPIEELAARGEDTMRYGPLKPVGLPDPGTGETPYAVVQLRQDNAAATAYNMVGFQTRLKWPEQKRVFSLIPGLEKAEFLRYGVMHRNTFINSPKLLTSFFCLRKNPRLFFAGQVTGVEGYVESAASGLVCGLNAGRAARGLDFAAFPAETALGALANYISNPAANDFQPMNINFGLFPPLSEKVRGRKNRNSQIAARALQTLARFCAAEGF